MIPDTVIDICRSAKAPEKLPERLKAFFLAKKAAERAYFDLPIYRGDDVERELRYEMEKRRRNRAWTAAINAFENACAEAAKEVAS